MAENGIPAGTVIRCRTCAHAHSLGPCQSNPLDGTCYCLQCHTAFIWDMAPRYLWHSNDTGTVRAIAKSLYMFRYQQRAAHTRRARKPPATGTCSECGKPVAIRRRPRYPGMPVYCRDSSRCKQRAWRRRQRARKAAADLTPAQDCAPACAPLPALARPAPRPPSATDARRQPTAMQSRASNPPADDRPPWARARASSLQPPSVP